MTSTTIERQIAELVATLVRDAQERIERAFATAIERELTARRNGDGDAVFEPSADVSNSEPVKTRDEVLTSTKPCTRCHELKPLTAFGVDRQAHDGRRAICRSCKSTRDREQRAARCERERVDEEPHPARRTTMRRGGFFSPTAAADAEQRRELLAELRANGVERELVDGREFVVLKLPSFELHGARDSMPPVRPRRARGYALA